VEENKENEELEEDNEKNLINEIFADEETMSASRREVFFVVVVCLS